MANYLVKQGDVYFFRRRVPEPLVNRLGKREIYRSLGTRSVRIARRRLLYLFHGTEAVFEMAGRPGITDEQLVAAVQYYLRDRGFYREITDLAPVELEMRVKPTILEDQAAKYIEANPEILVGVRTPAERERVRATVLGDVVDAFFARTGFADPSDSTFRHDEHGISARRVADAVNQEAERAVREQLARFTRIPLSPASMPRTKAGKRFSDVVDEFLDWRQGRTKATKSKCEKMPLAPQTELQFRTSFRLFETIMHDPRLVSIDRSTVQTFRERLATLPNSHGKTNGKVKTKRTIEQELARKQEQDLKEITARTMKRHFSALHQYFDYLVKKEFAFENPFSGQSFTISKEEVPTWSQDALLALFKHPGWALAPNDSAWHWLPLIALFTGMRLEEIARIRPKADVKVTRPQCVDDQQIVYVEVKVQDDWDPKTPAGKRLVPIHSWLITHGFLEYVRHRCGQIDSSRSKKTVPFLFPELEPSGPNENLTTCFSREFSRMKAKLKVPQGVKFHSFRHTFISQLANLDIPDRIIDAIVGHEEPGREVQRGYQKFTAHELHGYVERFQLPAAAEGVAVDAETVEAAPIEPNYLDFLHAKAFTRNAP